MAKRAAIEAAPAHQRPLTNAHSIHAYLSVRERLEGKLTLRVSRATRGDCDGDPDLGIDFHPRRSLLASSVVADHRRHATPAAPAVGGHPHIVG